MDTEAFITWALAEQRTLEEKYTVECLVSDGLRTWHYQQKNYGHDSLEERSRLRREQSLNPAYLPDYSELDLRRATECMPAWKEWRYNFNRTLCDISALAFFPHLEALHFTFHTRIDDWTPLTLLPNLRRLHIGYPGSLNREDTCEDFTPIARCHALRELAISFRAPWPDFTGIGDLAHLDTLHLTGNLLALPRDISFPHVKTASLSCQPLAMRDIRDMPHLPACEILTLGGAASLRGIEHMPALHSLTLVGPFKSYEPLTLAPGLLSLIVQPDNTAANLREQPFDLTPINRIPGLLYYQFGRGFDGFDLARDYSQLTESRTLREIFIQGCSDVLTEVAMVNAGLIPWDDTFLAPEPAPLPEPILFVIAPHDQYKATPFSGPNPPSTSDLKWTASPGIHACLGRWVIRQLGAAITRALGHTDWGIVNASAADPLSFCVEIHSFEALPRYPEIVDIVRRFAATLAVPSQPTLWILLRIPPPAPSEAMQALQKELEDRQEQWETDNILREQAEYRRNLNQLRLQEEQGALIDPDDYSPGEPPPYPQMEDLLHEKGLLRDDDGNLANANASGDDEDKNDEDDTFVADPTEYKNLSLFEDENEHPLADSYNLIATLYSDSIQFSPHKRDIAIHLMSRPPDIDIPNPENPAA